MKRILAITATLIMLAASSLAQDKKVITGFDGGMMIHTGYVKGNIAPLGYTASGAPLGIGGVARIHLGEHWRVGFEGYFSTLPQKNNGSIKYGWGGVLGDFYWTFERFMPYAGLTIGGGSATALIMTEQPSQAWAPIDNSYFNKQGFMALDPYIGCDYIISQGFHLTLKADWLCSVGRDIIMPSGPRIYFGFIFFH